MNLRDKLVKLAFENEDLRPHLLPLIKDASNPGQDFLKVLEDAGIPERTLEERNPSRVLSYVAKYVSDEGLFETFETGPLSYSSLKVASYSSRQGDDQIEWEAKLILPWEAATELVLYAVVGRYSPTSVKNLARNKDFRDIVSKGVRIRSARETWLYDSFTKHLERNSDFEIGADIGPYGSGVELAHYMTGLEGKWGPQGLLIQLKGESRL